MAVAADVAGADVVAVAFFDVATLPTGFRVVPDQSFVGRIDEPWSPGPIKTWIKRDPGAMRILSFILVTGVPADNQHFGSTCGCHI